MSWKNGKRWVYSITYDEGFQDLLKYALPLHRRYGIPGHVAVVASQVGVPRNVPGSTYNGMQILSCAEIDMLCAEGWGVSCHGMTHVPITEANVREELYDSRVRLSTTLGRDVICFCLPGNNDHLPIVAEHAKRAGYVANLTIRDDINTPSTDPFRLARVPLHTEYPPPFYSAYDPYKRIHQAIDAGGWLIDYCHCPVPGKALHPWKDCTTEELEQRFATILRLGEDDVWLAEPNDVISYLSQTKN